MSFTQYLKRKDIHLKASPSDIIIDTVGKRQFLRDKRSYVIKDMWYVRPLAESATGSSVDIICPYCGEIHRHGNEAGHRVSHCASPNNPGYIIVTEGSDYNAKRPR